MDDIISNEIKSRKGINYYVIAFISVGIIIFLIGNALEPDIENELDLFELLSSFGFVSATIFAFFVAKRYWGSNTFGKSYLSLALGYLCYSIGWNLFWVYEIYYKVENPYPYYPDIFFIAFYPLMIYHLTKNYHGFHKKFSKEQKIIISIIPIFFTFVYAFFGLVPVEVENGLDSLTLLAIPDYDETFYKEYFTGLVFVFSTSLTFSFAIVSTQVFRDTVLGGAWGLLLLGILLNTAADIYYYNIELFGGYERPDPVTGIWLAGTIFICYGLYKHQKEV